MEYIYTSAVITSIMNNPFDNVSNPFDAGTGGDPEANRRKGKVAEEMAQKVLRFDGKVRKVPDHRGGRDFEVYHRVTGELIYEVEVKAGQGQVTKKQEDYIEERPNDVPVRVMRYGNPPYY
jgi:transcriptional regulator of met regulon